MPGPGKSHLISHVSNLKYNLKWTAILYPDPSIDPQVDHVAHLPPPPPPPAPIGFSSILSEDIKQNELNWTAPCRTYRTADLPFQYC